MCFNYTHSNHVLTIISRTRLLRTSSVSLSVCRAVVCFISTDTYVMYICTVPYTYTSSSLHLFHEEISVQVVGPGTTNPKKSERSKENSERTYQYRIYFSSPTILREENDIVGSPPTLLIILIGVFTRIEVAHDTHYAKDERQKILEKRNHSFFLNSLSRVLKRCRWKPIPRQEPQGIRKRI